MSHKSRTPRPLWIRELRSDIETLKLNLANPDWGTLEAIGTALRPRIRLAWGMHAVGMALLGVSQRLDWACPSSFLEFYEDGFREGQERGRLDVVELWVTKDTEISVVGRLIMELGMDSTKVVAHLSQGEASDALDASEGRPGARIVRVADLSRDGVWLEDYGILLVDSALTPDEAKGLLADVTAP